MANAAVLASLEAQAQYEREGLSRVVAQLKKWLGAIYEVDSNGLVLTRSNATNVGTLGEVAAWTNQAIRLYAVHAASPAAATASAFVQIFSTSTASVTLGTTRPDVQFKLTAGKSKTVVFAPGNDDGDFSSALSYCVSTTAAGATGVNATNTPVVTFLCNK